MKTKAVQSAWIYETNRRLDAKPFLSGAFEARMLLNRAQFPRQPLSEVTQRVFHAGRESRLWVEDPDYGVPFLGSTAILKADLSYLPLISKKQVERNPGFLIRQGWTLITRSGTIGRMAYVRPDMNGMACSEHAMRVVPDEAKIPSGYLYAFLSSKFGVPMVTSGTYGAIIQHIEPDHIADLPVPRLKRETENEAHALVEKAAGLRSTASSDLADVISNVARILGVVTQTCTARGHQVVQSFELRTALRLDAFYFNPLANLVSKWATSHKNGYWYLEDVAHVYDVPPFKHIYVDSDQGLPFFMSGDLFKLDRSTDKNLSRTRTKGLEKYILEQGWVLLARSGQLGGIICRPQFADSALDGTTTSDHVIRIVPRKDIVPAGYIYAYLAMREVGYPLLTRTSCGSSVPALWPAYLRSIPVVKADASFMKDIDARVQAAFELRVDATYAENAARKLVETAIEDAA